MNFLLVNKFFWPKGGSEAVFFGEKELLEVHGHRVIPFSMKDERNFASPYERYFVDNVDFSEAGITRKLSAAGKIIFSLEARQKMSKLLKDNSVDIAHFHIFQHQISPSVFGPLRKKKIPLVLTLHDLKPICPNYKMYVKGAVCEACKGREFYNCFINKCMMGSRLKSLISTIEMYFHYMMGYYQNVDRYIAVSNFYRNKMIEYGFSEEQVRYIPNYIDANKYNLPYADKGYGLYFGRLSYEKGVDHLLEAAAIASDITFYIAGTGPSEEHLRNIVDKNQLSNVKFLGFVSGDDLQILISNASFTIMPSIWYENCPMSVLESLALKTPVIGANIGGIPELVDNDVDGLTYEAGNVGALVSSIKSLMQSTDKRRTMGEFGRMKIIDRFNKETHYQQLMLLYEELMH